MLDKFTQDVAKELEISQFDGNEEASGGGNFERVIFETGTYPAYINMYIDLGKQMVGGYKGAKKYLADTCVIGVAAFDYDNPNEDGTPRVAFIDTGTAFPLQVSLGAKANFKKIFTALNHDNDPEKKHILHFAGNTQSYLVRIEKRESKRNAGSYYNTVDLTTAVPSMVGQRGSMTREVLPEIDERDVAVFLWNNPTMEQWDSIRRGAEDVSPNDPTNFIQHKILQAANFEGSALDHMLRKAGVDTVARPKPEGDAPDKPVVNTTEGDEEPPFDEELPEEFDKPVKTVPKTMPAMPQMPTGESEESSEAEEV
mgnify:FL=1